MTKNLYPRMVSFLRPYLHWIAGLMLLSLVIVALEGLTYWFMAELLKSFFLPEQGVVLRPETIDLQTLNAYFKWLTYKAIANDNKVIMLRTICLTVAAIFLLKNAFSYGKALLESALNLRVVFDIRTVLYQHILRLPVSFYDRNRSGSIISLMVNDVTNINGSLTSTFEKLFLEPVRLISFLALIIVISPKLAMWVFMVFPPIAIIIVVIGKTVRRRSKRAYDQMAGILAILNETIAGVRAVKTFNMDDIEARRFRDENLIFNKTVLRSRIPQALSSPLIEAIGAIIAMTVLWFGGTLVLGHSLMAAEDFVKFLLLLFASYAPIKSLSGVNNAIQGGLASAERVFAVLDTKGEPLRSLAEPTPAARPFNRELRFENVCFTYPSTDREVLSDVSFTIKKGQVVALVGHSGSGKSTILDLIPRFYDINAGSITFDDVSTSDIHLVSLRAMFGIVAQDTVLFNDTVGNNIAYGCTGAGEQAVIEAAQAANAMEFIDQLPKGLHTEIGERGITLSGGQRQRLSIARALLRNPQMLLLDEATSALDTESERLVQSAINRLMSNRTALVVAHRLSTITSADMIVVLDAGRVVEQGTHDTLIRNNGKYRQLYDMQFKAAPVGV